MNEQNESLDTNKQILKEMLQDLKPTLIREAFLVELLLAYEKIDDNLKKRLLALNSRFASLDKRLIKLSDLDKEVRDALLLAINERFNDVVGKFESDLKNITSPLAEEKAELKKIGREAIKANNIVLQNIQAFEKNTNSLNLTLNKFSSLSKWLPFFVIISIVSILLNSILVWKLFF